MRFAFLILLGLCAGCGKTTPSLPHGLYPGTDLSPLAGLTARATFVGLGDPVHCTGGVYEARFRVLKYLVETQGFRAFLFENPTHMAEPLTAYLAACARGDEGPAEETVARSLYTVWNFRPVVDMFRWLCQYNAAHRTDPVRFYGFDTREAWWDMIQIRTHLNRHTAPRSLHRQLDRCEGVNWTYRQFRRATGQVGTALHHAWASDRFYAWEDEVQVHHTRTLSEESYNACISALDAVDRFLTTRPHAWASIASRGLRAWQGQMLYENPPHSLRHPARGHEARDHGMAERILAIHAAEFPNARTLIWAHNIHLAHNTPAFRHDSHSRYPIHQAAMMGTRLAQRLGTRYAAIGFLAYRVDVRWPGAPQWSGDFTLRSDSLEARLNAFGHDSLLIDTRASFRPLHHTLRMNWYQELARASDQYRALFFLKHSASPEAP